MFGEKYIISIDCGTQSSKVVVWDLKGNPVSEGRVKFDVLNPQLGWYEEEVDKWWPGTCSAIRKAIQGIDVSKIRALGITHQRETFVPVSAEGTPLRNALLYMDQRCLQQVQMVKKKIGERKVHEITGKIPCYLHSVYKILWIMDNEPHVHKRTYKYLDVQSYLMKHFIDRYLTSYVSADSTSLINIRKRTWDSFFMKAVGLREEQFPQLCSPGEIVGHITKQAARQSGLPEGLPVISGAGDGVCAALGNNILNTDRVFLIIGTFTAIGTYAPQYIIDDSFRTLCSCIPGSYNLEANTAGGLIINWFINNFKNDEPASATEKYWEKIAAEIPLGSEGLVTFPHWTGALAPSWDSFAHGVTAGWSGVHTRGHFYRSILEGIALEHKLLGEKMYDVLGKSFKDLIFVGGGARSSLWGQIVADVFDIPVSVPRAVETTALGAAILAAKAMGFYPSIQEAAENMTYTERKYIPNRERAGFYHNLYEEVYKSFFPRIQDLLSGLGKKIYKNRGRLCRGSY